MEIYPAKSKFWEPNIGETFNAFLDFVKSERGNNDPYDLNIIQNNAVNIALSLPLALAGIAETLFGLQPVLLSLGVMAVLGGVLTGLMGMKD